MALSEIEKLERRYAENPQGLTFAPLAEVHRKNGEVQRALDLLGLGLAVHPDYIPASIVLGRCHLDLGDVHAAEKAFLHVHSLDGENVIALKALADISERLLKFEEAERWLHELLLLDRSNDEAREQLQRVELARRQAEVASSAEPESTLEPEPSGEIAAAMTAGAAAGERAPESAPAYEPPVAEPAAGWVSHSASAQSSDLASPAVEDLEPSALRDHSGTADDTAFEQPAGLQIEEPVRDEPVRDEEEVAPLEGLVGREVDVPDALLDEFRVETSEDIVLRSSGGGEFQVPDASQELFSAGHSERGPFEEDTPLAPRPFTDTGALGAEPSPEPVAVGAPEPELLSMMPEPEPGLEPEPVAAEPDTFSVEPVAREAGPPDTAPEGPAPEPVVAAQALEPPAPPPPAAPGRRYAAAETGGQPVAHLLKGILAARPPAHSAHPAVRQPPAPGGAGAPTRPAADALSLSSVFGEEEAPGTLPAVPAAGTGAGVSFDDFFGAPGSAPPQRNPRAPDPKNDDLDQFHAWLQNLKR